MLRIAAAVGLLMAAALASAQQALLWGSLKPGPFPVGYSAQFQMDASRQFDPEYITDPLHPPVSRPRPILVAMWYPAVAKPGGFLRYREYLDLPKSSGFADRLAPFVRDTLAQETLGQRPEKLTKDELATFERFLATPTYAHRNAPTAKGRFPLVIYHPGLGGTYEDNSVLFEYLASNGFVVISSAYPVGSASHAYIDWDLERSLRDMDFLVHFAGGLSNVDSARVAAIGHSFGGQAVLAFGAEANTSLRAMVTLDSGMEVVNVTDPRFQKLKDRLDANVRKTRVPSLRFTQLNDEQHFDYLYPYLKYSPGYEATVGSVTHNDFLTHGAIGPALSPAKWPEMAKGKALRTSYDRICRHVLAFLQLTLKEDSQAHDFLTGSSKGEGLDRDFTLRFHPASPPPPTARQLLAIIETGGLDSAIALIRATKDEVETGGEGITGAGRALVEGGKLQLALGLYTQAAEIFPNSLMIFMNLGDAQILAGNKEQARAAYQKALRCIATEKFDDDSKQALRKQIEDKLAKLGS